MKNDHTPEVTPIPRATNAPRRKIFVRGLMLDAFIGVYDNEQDAAQPLKIDLQVEVIEPSNPIGDSLEDVVCYNKLTQGIKAIIAEGHIKLVETLAERVADLALSHPMAIAVDIRIEKPNAISEAAAAGVEISRTKNPAY